MMLDQPSREIFSLGRERTGGSDPRALASPFNAYARQRAAARLGMWLFLAGETVMFGALVCLYVVFHANRPELFPWGRHFLSPNLAILSTVVLLLSSFTMACVVRASQTRHRRALMTLLILTLVGGLGFVGARQLEYVRLIRHGFAPGESFNPDSRQIARAFGLPEDRFVVFVGDPRRTGEGKPLYAANCAACHGPTARGTGRAPTLTSSSFVQTQSPEQLADFLKIGRAPDDRLSLTMRQMPAKGGNPSLTDGELLATATFVKSLASGQPMGADTSGIAPANVTRRQTATPAPDAQLFFSIYFLLTGLHALHVIIGMVLLTYLIAAVTNNDFASGHATPVELIGLYWHFGTMAWLLVLPLLYLAL